MPMLSEIYFFVKLTTKESDQKVNYPVYPGNWPIIMFASLLMVLNGTLDDFNEAYNSLKNLRLLGN